MSREAFESCDWQAVIDAHRLESHDAAAWLRYASALLHTLQPGPEAGKQQQAALAFGQAQRAGASAGAVAAAQRQDVIANRRQALEAERATRQLPRLVLSYEQLLLDPAVALQRCQRLTGLPITTPSADLLGEWIRPGLNRHQGLPEATPPVGETQTLLQWADAVYAALVEPAAEHRELLDRAQAVVQQKLQALLEQGSRRVQLQLFWEPEAGGGFSEAASQRRSAMIERGRAKVVFQLPTGAERPRKLRLDLAEEPAMVTVLAMRLRSAEGTPVWQWPGEQETPDQERALPVRGLNPYTLVLPGGVVLAATADPGVVLEVAEEVLHQLHADAQLELEALWQPLPADVAKLALESKSAGRTTLNARPDD